jgi:hypothetical protein
VGSMVVEELVLEKLSDDVLELHKLEPDEVEREELTLVRREEGVPTMPGMRLVDILGSLKYFLRVQRPGEEVDRVCSNSDGGV